MNRRRAVGLISVVGGLILASPMIAVGVWMATTGVRLIMVAPSLAWTFWAIPIAGAVGVALMVYGGWTLLRRRRARAL